MPAEAVKELRSSRELADLAFYFGVSQEAMRHRLNKLGFRLR